MVEFSSLLAQGGAAPWLFIPMAIFLGALHGLEPGHSKTMMAAFIVAIRGTISQAIMLGLAATLSHTLVVWVVAMGGLYLGSQWDAETSEPYFQLISAVLIIGVAVWMLIRIRAEHKQEHEHSHHHHHDNHGYGHGHEQLNGLDLGLSGYQDAHELAHANDIKRRFDGQTVTNGQIVLFGLTGGLIPCPAAITVLFLCLQLKEIALGAALVLSFSVGLAITMVASGVIAALSVKYAQSRWSGFGTFVRRAPYFSCALILLIGCYVGYHGIQGILLGHASH